MLSFFRQFAERTESSSSSTFFRRAALNSSSGRLSSITAFLVETHCAACPECKEYFDGLLKARHPAAGDPPILIDSHVTRLMESLPPGEEFFLA